MLAIVGVVSHMLLTTMTKVDVEARNKQVLVDTFHNLVRYAFLKTYRDLVRLGVTQGSFSVDAMDRSLAARANAGTFENGAPSVKTLLQRSRGPSLTFHFYWAGNAGEPLEALFALSYKHDGDLEVKLLSLGLPERIPISPAARAIDGRKPFEEAVFELLRVLKGGRIEPYPPPR